MNVTNLLREALVVAHVVIVVARLPESRRIPQLRCTLGNGHFHTLNRSRKRAYFRLGNKNMNVPRHYHVRIDAKRVSAARDFEIPDKGFSNCIIREERRAVQTTESNEVRLLRFLIALQAERHGQRIALTRRVNLVQQPHFHQPQAEVGHQSSIVSLLFLSHFTFKFMKRKSGCVWFQSAEMRSSVRRMVRLLPGLIGAIERSCKSG